MSFILPEYRTPNPDQPWALIWKQDFGVTKVIRAHVENLPVLCREYGWHVLITDLDVPLELAPGQVWKASEPALKRSFYPPKVDED